jgi:hypothetical protein
VCTDFDIYIASHCTIFLKKLKNFPIQNLTKALFCKKKTPRENAMLGEASVPNKRLHDDKG